MKNCTSSSEEEMTEYIPPKMIRTLSTQHWEVTETFLLENNLLRHKAGEYGQYTFYVSRPSSESDFLCRETYENDTLVSSVNVPIKDRDNTSKQTMDLYVYKREFPLEKVKQDFMECIKGFHPVWSGKEPRYNELCRRYEFYGIQIQTDTTDFAPVETCMSKLGYQRYQHYNFYEHV